MSRRSALKALLSDAPVDGLAADNRAGDAAARDAPGGLGLASAPGHGGLAQVVPDTAPRGAGAVRALGLELNRLVKDAVEGGPAVVELDTDLLVPSPVRDRIEDEAEEGGVESLASSIRANGQHVPILVRRETEGGKERYRIAYGHRRWRACRWLGIPVRAVVAELSDEALIVAQGQENAERRDLSFIERAGFAAELEGRGHSRRLVGEALACDKSEVSRLLAVCRLVPIDLVVAIGRAPKAGRPRWMALGQALQRDDAIERAQRVTAEDGFQRLATDERFERVLRAIAPRQPETTGLRAVETQRDGRKVPLATLSGGRAPKIAIDREFGRPFADWLADRLPDLAEEWMSER